MDGSDPHSSQSQKTVSNMDFLGPDLTELILARLPIPSVIQASAVCKLWNSIINSNSFKTRASDSRRPPWFFLCGQNKSFLSRNQAFAFDPESDSWIKLPMITLLSKDSLAASNGFFFSTCPGKFSFKPGFNGLWRQTSTPIFSRSSSLIGAYIVPHCSKPARFVVVGGIKSVDALADVVGCLAVEIYNPHHDSWELCSPLPEIFRPGNSSKLLCSALFRGKFYVLSICSSFIASFDLEKRFWSNVQTLRPPGTLFSYLISCQDMLVLAGLCSINGDLEFNLWRIDEKTLEFSEIGIMPPVLLSMFIDSDDNLKFTSLKCMGSGNFIYVFKEERPWDCPVCVCEFSKSGKCIWRRVPSLPEARNEFEEVISFCSNVSILDILGSGSD
ncbi:F-box/kelch-repeat protein At3g24760 [Sesamum indicum]|uniref:F-box/kelch-repeat protein At3g24760 n=1 Tax=Sesamum indicum TaxID=4182 RepID=A0A6I9TCH5_SESIN|nr:F-box/kelch-repeat protein At3g24760 [Sesamum indicum]